MIIDLNRMRCPECGCSGTFSIRGRCWLGAGDGAEFMPKCVDDVAYGPEDVCFCDQCDYEGTVIDFAYDYKESAK